MKFLVTGAASVIGFHLSQHLCEQGHDVVDIENLNDCYYVNLNLTRLAELDKLTDCDAENSNECF